MDFKPTRPTRLTAAGSHYGKESRRTHKRAELVALDIVHDIVANSLQTGQHLLPEAVMADHYRVSRSTLREALRLLEVQGLIHLKPGPGGGPIVGSADPMYLARTAALHFHLKSANYRQLLSAQILIERNCAELAASHPDRQASMKPFARLAPPESLEEYREQVIGFHDTVYQLAANPVLTLLAGAITHIATAHVVATMEPVERHGAILDEHVAMARAIAAGQVSRAGRLMAAHFRALYSYYEVHWPARLEELIEWR